MEGSFSIQSVFIYVNIVRRKMKKAALNEICIHGILCLFAQSIVQFNYLAVTHDMAGMIKHIHQLFRACGLVKSTGHSYVLGGEERVPTCCKHKVLGNTHYSKTTFGFFFIIVEFIPLQQTLAT